MMRRITMLGVALPLFTGAFALAEEPMQRTDQQRTTEARPADAKTNRDMAQEHSTKRVSKLMGLNVYGNDGKKLGDIKDVVLDGDSNHVSYAVLAFGGFLGMGDKYFAVPWGAIQWKAIENKSQASLDVNEDSLKNAPGFDKNHWPDMADAAFRQQVDLFYHYDRDKDMANRANDNANRAINENNQAANAKTSTGLVWTRRASEIIGTNVVNNSNEGLGEIKDLVTETHSGQIHYAVLSYGGVLGIGDKLFAVPMTSLQTKADSQKFVLNVTPDRLKNAPGFNDKNWPDFADPSFRTNVDEFYGGTKGESKEGSVRTE